MQIRYPSLDFNNIEMLKTLNKKKYRLGEILSNFQVDAVQGIGFGVMNPELVKKMYSVVEAAIFFLYFLEKITSQFLSPVAIDFSIFVSTSCPRRVFNNFVSVAIIASHNSLLVPSIPRTHFGIFT